MGSGAWDSDTYSAARAYRIATGTSAFEYSDSGATSVHATLDPKGVVVREARDSDDHPNSLPIAVLFDVTGSMRDTPRIAQEKLPELFGLLLRKGYVEDPQILFGAIGDATCDRAPLQVGQFESDNRLDEHLGNIYLEGGGGGQKTESYELGAYFMARHVVTDAWEKRGQKGFLFLMGDEMSYGKVKSREVNAVIAGPDGKQLEEDISTKAIFEELLERWNVYYILPDAASHAGDKEVLGHWRELLGQNVIQLADMNALVETIALAVGLEMGTIDLDDGLADLKEIGSGAGKTVSKALATIGAKAASGSVATAVAPSDLSGDDSVARL